MEPREKFQIGIRKFVEKSFKNDLISTIFVVIAVEIALLFSGFSKGLLLTATFLNLVICLFAIRSFRNQAIKKYRRLSKFTDEHWKATE